MKKIFWSLVTITAVFAIGITLTHPDWVVDPTFPKAYALSSDKLDQQCTGFETVGRCADKCPAPTSEGTYYLQGFDKETGAAVCGFTYFNPCPYADAQPADGPVCQKLTDEANTQQQQTTPNDTPPAVTSQPQPFEGK